MTLCFGLSSAPRVFTKILTTVLGFLRSVFLLLILGYLDDFLIVASSEEKVARDRDIFIVILTLLGFQIHQEKSFLVPCQRLLHLGFIWDSSSCTVELPEVKIQNIIDTASTFLKQKGCTAKQLERFVGVLVSVRFVVVHCPLYYRSIQKQMIQTRRFPRSFVTLSRKSLQELRWWKLHFRAFTSRSLLKTPISVTITTDASSGLRPDTGYKDVVARDPEFRCSNFSGFGAYNDRGAFLQREWSGSQSDWHINTQELYGAGQAIERLSIPGDHILLRIDNVTAKAFLRRYGGTRSLILNDLAVKIRKRMLSQRKQLSLQFVSSQDNETADMLSRFHFSHWEFSLKVNVFQSIISHWKLQHGIPTLDVFASERHHLLARYAAWLPDPMAVAQDCFTMAMWDTFSFIHPPTPLLNRVLMELSRMRVKAILIAPFWPHKLWWATLNRVMLDWIKLPPPHLCLTTKSEAPVVAFLDPLYAFLVDGSL